jgi:hypothetical protein
MEHSLGNLRFKRERSGRITALLHTDNLLHTDIRADIRADGTVAVGNLLTLCLSLRRLLRAATRGMSSGSCGRRPARLLCRRRTCTITLLRKSRITTLGIGRGASFASKGEWAMSVVTFSTKPFQRAQWPAANRACTIRRGGVTLRQFRGAASQPAHRVGIPWRPPSPRH